MKTIAIFELANAIFLGVILIGQLSSKDKTKAAKWLRITLLFFMIHLVIDALAYTLVGSSYPFALRYAVNLMAYSMSGIDMLCFIMYCSVFISGKSSVKQIVFRIPLIAAGLCTIASAVLFIAGKLIVYENGIAVAVNDIPIWLRLIEILILFYTPAVILRYRKEIGWKAVLLLVIYSLTPVITGIAAVFIGTDYSIIMGAVDALLVASVVQAEEQHEQLRTAFEKEKEFNRIIGALSEDYSVINYVELTDDENDDIGINYRTTDTFKKLIPNADDMGFTEKILALSDAAVYEPDREQFYRDTRRNVVIEALNDYETYTLYPRLLINDEIEYYEMKFSAIKEDGRVTALVAGLRSIDEEKKKELEAKHQIEEALSIAESASKAKTEFLFNMSHDVRTPMNAIIGFTNIAEKHIDDKEKVLDCLEKTKRSSNLLLSLINGVLDMSRIEHGSTEIMENAGDVMLSFVNIEETLRGEAEKKDISLSFKFGEVPDRFVYADFTRCLRVLTNLITNSIKYTKDGGYINVRCEQISPKENGYALYQYTIADNGIGMSKSFQEHMFESFTREHNSTTSGIQGTGLGLAVCKSFVDYMGGTIECESELEKGTRFTVTFPFKVQEGAVYTDPLTGELIDSALSEPKTEKKVDFVNRKVLLVEDNELNREIAMEILEDEGLVVETAEDGSIAVELMKEKGPDYYDFILMDIQMPVMNGYEATKAIREMYPDASVPIIALSANAFDEDKQKSLEAGMDDHVAKPINIKELFGALAKYL